MKIELNIDDIKSGQLTERQCKYIEEEFEKYMQSETKSKLYELVMHVMLCDKTDIPYE